MRTAQLRPSQDRFIVKEVPSQTASDSEVVVRVTGAIVCRSDVQVLNGRFDHAVNRPATPGHGIAGVIETIGPQVTLIAVGDPVIVMVGWVCGECHWCRTGHPQICPQGREAGSTADGGFAEVALFPHERFVILLRDVTPSEATPLGCARSTAYTGLWRVLPTLKRGGALVITDTGVLGEYAVHLARRLSHSRIIAADKHNESPARAMGAVVHHAVANPWYVRELCGPFGARTALDSVDTDETLSLAAAVVRPRGWIALVGIAGGTLDLGFESLSPEASFTTVWGGTLTNLNFFLDHYQLDRLALLLHSCSREASTALSQTCETGP